MKYIWICLVCLPLWAQSDKQNGDERVLVEPMVVTATKQERKLTDLPASVTVLEKEQLMEKGTVLAGEAVAEVPGVFMRRDGAGADALSIQIRGLTGVHGNDTFLALLDGIPFVSAHEEVLLAEIPIGATERIEVIRGPVSALYGRGALSGAVNYITRSPSKSGEMSLELRGDSQGYVRPHFSASLSAGSHNLLVDGYAENASGWRDQTEREATNILIKDEFVISPVFRLDAYANAYRSKQGAGGQIPLDTEGNVLSIAGGRTGFVGYEPNSYDRETVMAALRLLWHPSDHLELETTLHYRAVSDNNVLNFYDPFGFDPDNHILRVNGFENDRQTDVWFVEPRVTWSGTNHSLIAGLNWERVTLDETDWWTGQNGFNEDTFEYYFYEINIDYSTGEIVNRHNPYWVDRNETYNGASSNRFNSAYLQDEWALNERAKLTLGLRYDAFEREARINSDVDFDGEIDINPTIRDEEANLSPKLALHYHFNNAFNGYLSYGEGFNSNFGAVWQWDPSLFQRGSEVKPSVVRSLELGAKGQADKVSYSASIYNMVQTDRLVFVPSPDGFGLPRAATAGEFESTGLEMESNVLLAERWSANFAYAFVDAVWNDFSIGGLDYSGKQPIGVPEHTLSLGLRTKLSEFTRLWSNYHYYDDYFITNDNRVSGGGHELLDIGAGFHLPSFGAQINLVGKNVLDKDYYYLFGSNNPLNATPGQPARFLLSVTLKFGN